MGVVALIEVPDALVASLNRDLMGTPQLSLLACEARAPLSGDLRG